jgi:RNA polymerase sigma-70 factor (ECF subfamily)
MTIGATHLSSSVLQKLRERDPGALTAIVGAHSRRLYRTARALGFEQADAEDLTQDVFVTFLATLDRFEGRSSINTWLIGILYRKAQERRRIASKTVPHDPADAVFESWFDTSGKWKQHPQPPDEAIASREAAASIAECLSGLPTQQREVFQWRQVEELSGAQVSNILDLSITHTRRPVRYPSTSRRPRTCVEFE